MGNRESTYDGPYDDFLPQQMGNRESTYDDPRDDFMHQPPSYAGSSMEPNHRFLHQPPPDTGSSTETNHQFLHQPPPDTGSSTEPNHRFLHQPPPNTGSSTEPNYHHTHQSSYIADNFNSLDQVISSLREYGLESSNLILGIDFTKSNEWTGKHSFNRKSLHAIGNKPNPYEQAISIIGRTLSSFDEDNLIPCFGFGDASTHDRHVFSFYHDHRYCHGFEELLARYREILPYLKLSGPTSFAPIIDAAIDIVERNDGQYHVLVIIADGQVTRNPDVPPGRFSPQEEATINSIVAASQYPLSIILVGVGDGPWDAMQQFDDNIPHRSFDNFQFVNFTKIMSENTEMSKKEATFALAALMEIPFQYRAAQRIEFVHRDFVDGPRTKPLPPPPEVIDHDNAVKSSPHITSFESVEKMAPVEQVCPICLTNQKDMAFGCGHTTCKDCGRTLSLCPLCRKPITTRLRLYS